MAYGEVFKTPSGMIECGGCPLMDMGCDVETPLAALEVLSEADVKIADMMRNIYLRTIGG